ncbi:hypothetical protein [Rufibacter roseus]|uniref:Glycosyltransferase RgtA/B/C/D-like domain-containing protein n=1 Tax=Rufibacter roseus TaxID=1567108 RepID=A0ABW2DNT6_9BACT|nr:hypothetical protein [Rufibacter roseus]
MSENVKLLLLYVAICLVIVARVAVEKNGYTTPDSVHYINAAQSIVDKGTLYYEDNDEVQFFSLWPAGYPLSIAFVHFVTDFSLLWCSKIVNLLWLLLAFFIIKKNYPAHATWVALVFCANSMLENFSYTWSEGGFMVCLLWFCLEAYKLATDQRSSTMRIVKVIGAGILVFLYRYVGGFVLALISLLGIWTITQKKYKRVIYLCFAGLLIAGGIVAYFSFISANTGHYSGATRVSPDETVSFLLTKLFQAQLNEFLLIRKISFVSFDPLAFLLLLFQVLLISISFYRMKNINEWRTIIAVRSSDSKPLFLALSALIYWSIIVVLRLFIMKFDVFDFRILAPASLLLLLALHMYLADSSRIILLKKIQVPISIIYLLALAHGLYKKNLFELLLG